MTEQYKQDSNFVWTDLSSYDTSKSRSFYEKVFGWQTYDMGKMSAEGEDRFGMDQVNYYVATHGEKPTAGIFDMPPFFQKIKMPPFWMSYLAVNDIGAVVERARGIEGAVIDVEPSPFGEGTMALIRDPLGAGFTCYDGPSINAKGDGSVYGRLVWNELITKDIAAVTKFYEHVVGLQLVADSEFGGKRVKVLNGAGEEIAGIQEVAESIRGPKVYWLPFFSVDSVAAASERITAAGGEVISTVTEGTSLFMDNTGAGCAIAETGADYTDNGPAWLTKVLYNMFS